jgi:hypothetical protein
MMQKFNVTVRHGPIALYRRADVPTGFGTIAMGPVLCNLSPNNSTLIGLL